MNEMKEGEDQEMSEEEKVEGQLSGTGWEWKDGVVPLLEGQEEGIGGGAGRS